MNWRWLHNKEAYNNCLGDSWDKDLCPDPETCSQNCALEGVDEKAYTESYKAIPVDHGIKLTFPKAPRMYMVENDDSYKMFKLLNQEIAFDVDLSSLPCGLNAAIYLIEMPQEGDGHGGSIAGAKYGTGYCDAQCPHMKFIKGKANTEGFGKHKAQTPEQEWTMLGPEGKYGICCAEMDLLEANTKATAFTAHPCKLDGPKQCDGDKECGDKLKGESGFCDKDECGWNSYRMGDSKFWGPGSDYTVDTTKPITVVTQFITSDETDQGDLVEIRQLYVQDGNVIKQSQASALKNGGDSLTQSLCDESNKKFNATNNDFTDLGGLKQMGKAIGRGMVMSLSIWDDNLGRMLWLDGKKTSVKDEDGQPGVERGPCDFKYGSDDDLQKYAKLHGGGVDVIFSNIKYGDIGSTYPSTAQPSQKFEAGTDVAAASLLRPQAVDSRLCSQAVAVAGLLLIAGLAVMAVFRQPTRHSAPTYQSAPCPESSKLRTVEEFLE